MIRSVKIFMSGDGYYPKVLITRRDGSRRLYQRLYWADCQRLTELWYSHRGAKHLDIANSAVEIEFVDVEK